MLRDLSEKQEVDDVMLCLSIHVIQAVAFLNATCQVRAAAKSQSRLVFSPYTYENLQLRFRFRSLITRGEGHQSLQESGLKLMTLPQIGSPKRVILPIFYPPPPAPFP